MTNKSKVVRIEHFQSTSDVSNLLTESTSEWVQSTFGSLNSVQCASIPLIIKKRSTLIMSPTGSGKTLSAFLGIISELLKLAKNGKLLPQIYCLYISPLKALGNDIHKNLEIPLSEIKGEYTKLIKIAKRTGDTPNSERAKMLRNPPHILITTPESFALMLTAPKFRLNFKSIQWLIIDEIHSIASNKRGTMLSICIERLENFIQKRVVRVGLSATVEPPELIANFLIGNHKRQINIIDFGKLRKLELDVISPVPHIDVAPYNVIQKNQLELIQSYFSTSRTTIVFSNTRHMSEKLSFALKEKITDFDREQIAVHHGSLDKNLRLRVEEKMKQGEMRAVFTSTSLEMGIDIGTIDLTVQLGSTKKVSTMLQRIGRSGHSQNLISKGKVIIYNRDDLIESAVVAKMALEGNIEDIKIPEKPYDVLIQLVVAFAVDRRWKIDDAYEVITHAYPFRNLTKDEFMEVLIAASNPTNDENGWKYGNIWVDMEINEFGKRKRSRQAYMQNLGTIPNISMVRVVLEGFRTNIGQVSENFSEKLDTNDIFLLNGRTFKYIRSVGNKIIVREAHGAVPTVPSWDGEAMSRTWDVSVGVSELLEKAEVDINKGDYEGFHHWLLDNYPISEVEAEIILQYLIQQISFNSLPKLNLITVEEYNDPTGAKNILVLAIYGKETNAVISQALARGLSDKLNINVAVISTDNGFLLRIPPGISYDHGKLFEIIDLESFEQLFIRSLKNTELFRNRFRHAAARSLMILKSFGSNKTRVDQQIKISRWLLKELPSDFIIIRETIREILHDTYNFEKAMWVLKNIETKVIEILVLPGDELPSPMTHNILMNGNLDLIFIEDKRSLLLNLHKQVVAKLLPEINSIGSILPKERIFEYFNNKLNINVTKDPLFSIEQFTAQSWHYENYTEFTNQLKLKTGINENEFQEYLSENKVQLFKLASGSYISESMHPFYQGIKPISDEGDFSIANKTISIPREVAIETLIIYYLSINGPSEISKLSKIFEIDISQIEPVVYNLMNRNEILSGNFISNNQELLLVEDRNQFLREIQNIEDTDYSDYTIENHKLRKLRLVKSLQTNKMTPSQYLLENGPFRNIIEIFNRLPNLNPSEISNLLFHQEIYFGKFLGRRLVFIHKSQAHDFIRIARSQEPLNPLVNLVYEVITGFPGITAKEIGIHVSANRSDITSALNFLEGELYISRLNSQHLGLNTENFRTKYIILPEINYDVDKHNKSLAIVIKNCFKWYGFSSINDLLRILRIPYPTLEYGLSSLREEIVSFIKYSDIYYGFDYQLDELNYLKNEVLKNYDIFILSPTDPFFYTSGGEYSRYQAPRSSRFNIIFQGKQIGNLEYNTPNKDIFQIINLQLNRNHRRDISLLAEIALILIKLAKVVFNVHTIIVEEAHYKSLNDKDNLHLRNGFEKAGFNTYQDILVGGIGRIYNYQLNDINQVKQLNRALKVVDKSKNIDLLFNHHPIMSIDELDQFTDIENFKLLILNSLRNNKIHLYQNSIISDKYWLYIKPQEDSDIEIKTFEGTLTYNQLKEHLPAGQNIDETINNALISKKIELITPYGRVNEYRFNKASFKQIPITLLRNIVLYYVDNYGPLTFDLLLELITKHFGYRRTSVLLLLAELLDSRVLYSSISKKENDLTSLLYFNSRQKLLLEDPTRNSKFKTWEIVKNDRYIFSISPSNHTHLLLHRGEVILSFLLIREIDIAVLREINFSFNKQNFNFNEKLAEIINEIEDYVFKLGYTQLKISKIQDAFPNYWIEIAN